MVAQSRRSGMLAPVIVCASLVVFLSVTYRSGTDAFATVAPAPTARRLKVRLAAARGAKAAEFGNQFASKVVKVPARAEWKLPDTVRCMYKFDDQKTFKIGFRPDETTGDIRKAIVEHTGIPAEGMILRLGVGAYGMGAYKLTNDTEAFVNKVYEFYEKEGWDWIKGMAIIEIEETARMPRKAIIGRDRKSVTEPFDWAMYELTNDAIKEAVAEDQSRDISFPIGITVGLAVFLYSITSTLLIRSGRLPDPQTIPCWEWQLKPGADSMPRIENRPECVDQPLGYIPNVMTMEPLR